MEHIEGVLSRYNLNCMDANVFILLCLGNWPLLREEHNTWFKGIRCLKYIALFGCFLHSLVAAYDVTTKLSDYERLSESVMLIIYMIKATLRLTIGVFRNNIVVDLVTRLDTFATDLTKEEKLIFLRYKRRATLYTVVHCIVYFFYGAVFTIVPIFESGRQFPGHVQLPFYVLDTPVYEVVYTLCALVGPMDGTINAVGDSFVISALIYITSFLHILKYRLEHTHKYAKMNTHENLTVVSKMLQTNKSVSYEIDSVEGYDTLPIIGYNNVKNTIVDASLYETESSSEAGGVNVTFLQESTNYRPKTVDIESRFLKSAKTVANKLGKSKRVKRGVGYGRKPQYYKPNQLVSEAVGVAGISRQASNKCPCPNRVDLKPRVYESMPIAGVRRLRKDTREILSDLENEEHRQLKEGVGGLAMVEHLRRCVQFHDKLIGYVDHIQATTSLALFFELSVGAAVTCIALFQTAAAVSSEGLSVKFFVWLTYLIMIILQLLAVFWACSEVADESRNVSDAMYFSDWLDTPLAYKRSMLIIMSRALDHIQLRAASFLPFTMEVFRKVMNSGYSYFNMVTQMQNKKL